MRHTDLVKRADKIRDHVVLLRQKLTEVGSPLCIVAGNRLWEATTILGKAIQARFGASCQEAEAQDRVRRLLRRHTDGS